MNFNDLSQRIEKRYRDYLNTLFYLKDPALRASFQQVLQEGALSKGPYLEATPIFKTGEPPHALFERVLGHTPDDGFLHALHAERPLYSHQTRAIEKIADERNVVVATGTGSGKTESFLYPILLHLYKEFQQGTLGPGVRALILYPMNALVNDQRERLGEIARQLKNAGSSFSFTFGQYVGETPNDARDRWRNGPEKVEERDTDGYTVFDGDHVRHGEMVLRSEMRETPPHILLTNYSMLEYLLLRPDDSPLFDRGAAENWTFFVLDEAHQYRGAQGMEMGMLLRRLKQRLHEGGRTKPFRCVATSATLVEDDDHEKGRGDVAKFAEAIFGEPFDPGDIIFGERRTLATEETSGSGQRLEPLHYHTLTDTPSTGSVSETITRHLGLATDATLAEVLERDARATQLRETLNTQTQDIVTLARTIFTDTDDSVSALTRLVDLLSRAKDATGTPLLRTRYHFFLRSLEGAFLSFWPEPKVVLDRKGDGTAFELALCRECGQHYLVGKNQGSRLVEAIRDPSQKDFGATFFRPLETRSDAAEENDLYELCIRCGALWPEGSEPVCGHGATQLLEQAPAHKKEDDQTSKCLSCGYSAPDPVREVIYGNDGPHSVIATTLYGNLPEERAKILAFADGRQEAAFFAWYLDDSYRGILNRHLILKALQQSRYATDEGDSIDDIANELQKLYKDRKLFPKSASRSALEREAHIAVYREFLSDQTRVTLEGVGLIRWRLELPETFSPPASLHTSPWSLSSAEVDDLILYLLDTMRNDQAVAFANEVIDWSALDFQRSQNAFTIGTPGNRRGIKSWDGPRGRRAAFLAKLLQRRGLDKAEATDKAQQLLREVWEALQVCDKRLGSDEGVLISANNGKRLNSKWWRAQLLNDNSDVALFECDTCGQLHTISVGAVCTRHRCAGSLVLADRERLVSNHYRQLYERDVTRNLRVEEHTAQLSSSQAKDFQRDFKEGRINVLSCSTTFEVGVDLGDLDTVFLRNVPPEAFNYAQRVGRAGRRNDYPGYALTYCRRSPHDLYHFANPERMLSGHVNAPVLDLSNEKIIGRHMLALLLSEFFRAYPERFSKVEGFVGSFEEGQADGVAAFAAFLHERRASLQAALHQIVPDKNALHDTLSLGDERWIAELSNDDSRLRLAEQEIVSDYQNVRDLMEVSKQSEEFRRAEWAKARAATLANEDVLTFLSRKAVIPKYGFPVDLAELDIQAYRRDGAASSVSLQRDLSLAVAEFAPGSKLIANKQEWTSYGLKRVAGREWPRYFYGRCSVHNRFIRDTDKDRLKAKRCCSAMRFGEYLDPIFGFITDSNPPKEPQRRPSRSFSTRPYFAGFKDAAQPTPRNFGALQLTPTAAGYMVVLCEGQKEQKFFVCDRCGAGFTEAKAFQNHKTPYGNPCSQRVPKGRVALGHEFVTDMVKLQFQLALPRDEEYGWAAYAVAYAVVEGAAEVLEVPSRDISATIAYGSDGFTPIILYDDVPGGAGLVARLEDRPTLIACLEAAHQRVSGQCGCDEATSCYGCLRNYGNQFAHQHLKRGVAHDYLGEVLAELGQSATA